MTSDEERMNRKLMDEIEHHVGKIDCQDADVQHKHLRILCNIATDKSCRESILEAMQRSNTCLEKAFEHSSPNNQVQVLLLICLIRVSHYRFDAQDLLELFHDDIKAAVMTVLAALEQSNVKVETSLLVSCVYMLYTLTMPSSFYSEGFHKVDEFTDKMDVLVDSLRHSKFYSRLVECDRVVEMLDSDRFVAPFLNHLLQMTLNAGVFSTDTSFFQHAVLDTSLGDKLILPYLCFLTLDEKLEALDAKDEFECAWFEFHDETTHTTYFYNQITKESVWEIPQGRETIKKPTRAMQHKIDGVTQCLRLLCVASYHLVNHAGMNEHWFWQSTMTDRDRQVMNPALILLSQTQYAWFFTHHYMALLYLLLLNINLDTLVAADDGECDKETQDTLCEAICRTMSQLDEESRARLNSMLLHTTAIPIQRDNSTFKLIAGALSAPIAVGTLNTSVDEWEELYDEEQDCVYYYNARTNESYWEKPAELSSNWVELWSEDYHRYYFFNSETQISTWERPIDAREEESENTGVVLVSSWMEQARQNLAANVTIDSRENEIESRYRLLGDLPELKPPKGPPPVWDRTLGPSSPKRRKSKKKKKKKIANDIAPSEFLCEISRTVMLRPFRSIYGNVFEKSSIKRWLRKVGGVCPITHKALNRKDLTLDIDLRDKIQEWRIEQSLRSNSKYLSNISATSTIQDDDDLYDFN